MTLTKLKMVEREMMDTSDGFVERVETAILELGRDHEIVNVQFTADKFGSPKTGIIIYNTEQIAVERDVVTETEIIE